MKVHVRFRFKNLSKRVDSGNIMVEQNYDRHCIRNVIFGEILESDHSIYNQEWQDLHKSLTTLDRGWKYLANHVSLWHWKERFDFFIKLSTWGHYGKKKMGFVLDPRSRFLNMDILLRDRLPQYLNWNTTILPNFVGSPLLKFLSASTSSYDSSVFDLIRFIRNVYQHITDKKKDDKYLYIDRHVHWAKEEVTEHEVSKVFPKLLLELTAELSVVNFIRI
ncbi:hypothetical protein RHGRI_015843 [Rhododendron griersonianum]|uniref:KEN domain-containing protein n=1 Tax=Rhododendron griersonianum TaxID=479676 RepID=A0AAV6JNR6_9ERIC|nr:hypothetical protein RHGRI_015843 [Rhododendron griersonianum]